MSNVHRNDMTSRDSPGISIQTTSTTPFPLFKLPYRARLHVARYMRPADLVAHSINFSQFQDLTRFSKFTASYLTWRISENYPDFSYIEVKLEHDEKRIQVFPPVFDEDEDSEAPKISLFRFRLMRNQNTMVHDRKVYSAHILKPNYRVESEKESFEHVQNITSILLRILKIEKFHLRLGSLENYEFLKALVWRNTKNCILNIDCTSGFPVDQILNMDCAKLKISKVAATSQRIYDILNIWMHGGYSNLEELEFQTEEAIDDSSMVELGSQPSVIQETLRAAMIEGTTDIQRECDGKLATFVIYGCDFKFFVWEQ